MEVCVCFLVFNIILVSDVQHWKVFKDRKRVGQES